MLLPAHHHFVLEVYRKLPHSVADGLWYAREGGWGETTAVSGLSQESDSHNKKKTKKKGRSRHDRALVV